MIERACFSDPGKQAGLNEDAYALPAPGVDETRFGTLLVIADGTGGLPEGEEASREAVHYLQCLYYAAPRPDTLPDRLRQSVEQVNALNRLVQRQPGLEPGHLTTLVAAVIHTDQIWVANVGDSRAYLVQAASRTLIQLTEDHSDHVRNVKVGLVNEADLDSRESGIITRAIGLQDDCQVDIYHYTWSPGDRLVLCSDGLSHLMPEVMIAKVLDNPPQKAARDLVMLAIEKDDSDNCTAMVANWSLPDQPDLDPGNGVRSISSAPAADKATNLSPALRLKVRPGARVIFLGVMLGWLSAGLLAVVLEFGRMLHIF